MVGTFWSKQSPYGTGIRPGWVIAGMESPGAIENSSCGAQHNLRVAVSRHQQESAPPRCAIETCGTADKMQRYRQR
jgi:hypothetical protein